MLTPESGITTKPIRVDQFNELPGRRWDGVAGTDRAAPAVPAVLTFGEDFAIMRAGRAPKTAAEKTAALAALAILSHPLWAIGKQIRRGRPLRVKRDAHLTFAVEMRSNGTYVRLAGRRRDSAKRCDGKTEAILLGLSGGETAYPLANSSKSAVDGIAQDLRQFLCRCVPTTQMRSVIYGSVHGSVHGKAIRIDESLRFTIDDNQHYQIAGDVDCWDVSEQF